MYTKQQQIVNNIYSCTSRWMLHRAHANIVTVLLLYFFLNSFTPSPDVQLQLCYLLRGVGRGCICDFVFVIAGFGFWPCCNNTKCIAIAFANESYMNGATIVKSDNFTFLITVSQKIIHKFPQYFLETWIYSVDCISCTALSVKIQYFYNNNIENGTHFIRLHIQTSSAYRQSIIPIYTMHKSTLVHHYIRTYGQAPFLPYPIFIENENQMHFAFVNDVRTHTHG